MTKPSDPQVCKGVFLANVVSNNPISSGHMKLILEMEHFPPAAAGQFVQILCADPFDDKWSGGAMLRRPFSIGGLRRDGDKSQIDIYQRIVGVGTSWMAKLRAGDVISVLGPLGKPFPIMDEKPRACLVGGGVGLPPLIWLAEELARSGKKTLAFCGARSAVVMPMTRRPEVQVSAQTGSLCFEEFARSGVPAVVSTDDGSLGAKAIIPDVFADYLKQHPIDSHSLVVYTCGPNRMMQAVAEVCEKKSILCYVSLERTMACGMGTCQSCVVRVHDQQADDQWRYQLCCTDGPVFDSRLIIWDQ